MSKEFAVLTGDIVKSGKIVSKLEDVQILLKSIPQQFNLHYKNAIQGDVSIYRGDGWQLLLTNKDFSMRLALYIKALLKSEYNIETRLVIGIGKVDYIDNNNISASSGEAFELSGIGLDNLDKNCYLKMIDHHNEPHLDVPLLDCLFRKLTLRQAEALHYALLDYKQLEIVETINKKFHHKETSQQAVAKLLKNCCWNVIQQYLYNLERLY